MRATDIIARKRDGLALSEAEIRWFIERYTAGDLPDYQAAALLMAIYLRGMNVDETMALTQAMVDSGETLSFKGLIPYTVDKHSTGGVGDKTSLALTPTVAALGLPVAKMSGRGLSFSGGTLDKLESIPGFRAVLSADEFRRNVREVGLVIAGQNVDLAPADGKLYALRDVTATVDAVPLIASSVMSKKLAGGADAIVLDVKVGHGAFVETLEKAEALARLMVQIGTRQGRAMTAILTDMHQPLGDAVGNALELREAIDTLHGGGPARFRELVVALAGHMLHLGRVAPTPEAGQDLARAALDDGRAWAKFRQFIAAQGGDLAYVDQPERLPKARYVETVVTPRAGYLRMVDARQIGLLTVRLGAGRERKGDAIDHAVGIVVHAKVGDRCEIGDILFTVHANQAEPLASARAGCLAACAWSDEPVPALPLIYRVIV